jgi:hypothetical protein
MYTVWNLVLVAVWAAAGGRRAPAPLTAVVQANALLVACAVLAAHLVIPDVYVRLVRSRELTWPTPVAYAAMAAVDVAAHFLPVLLVGLPGASTATWSLLAAPAALVLYNHIVNLPDVYLASVKKDAYDRIVYCGVAVYGLVVLWITYNIYRAR